MATSRSLGSMSLTTRSPMETMPLVTSSRPATMRNAVVLPQPEEPSRTRSSPSAMCNVRLSTAVVSPNRLVTPSKLTCANRAPFGRPAFGHGLLRRRDGSEPMRAAARCQVSAGAGSAGGDLPSHALGDFLAGGAQAVALGVPAGHPFLAAEGPHRSPVDDPLDHRGPCRDELALLPALGGGVPLQDDVGHPVVIAVLEVGIRPGGGPRRAPGPGRAGACLGAAHG